MSPEAEAHARMKEVLDAQPRVRGEAEELLAVPHERWLDITGGLGGGRRRCRGAAPIPSEDRLRLALRFQLAREERELLVHLGGAACCTELGAKEGTAQEDETEALVEAGVRPDPRAADAAAHRRSA